MYVARKSNNIESDIKRNWSSWNFGEAGFNGTIEQLEEAIENCTDELPVFISGMEIYPDNKNDFSFGELYENYIVVIDTQNASNGLSCINLDSENLEDAVIESNKRTDYFAEGNSFNANFAKLVYSNNEIHIFEI